MTPREENVLRFVKAELDAAISKLDVIISDIQNTIRELSTKLMHTEDQDETDPKDQ